MNASNSTCKSSTIQQDLVPVWFCITLIVLNAAILLVNITGFSLLLRYILSSPKKDRTPSHTFFFCISMVSLLGTVIGIPISILAAGNRFEDKVLATLSHYVQSRVLYLSFSLVIHYFASITTERYLTITSKTEKISVRKSKWAIAVVTTYVVATWLIIIFDDVCIFTPTDCPSVIWNVLHNKQGEVSCSNMTSVLNSTQIPQKQGSNSKIPLVVITIWITLCNFVISVTTLTTLRFINLSIQSTTCNFRMFRSKFESRRLKVVYTMVSFFSLLWIPYGISAGLQKRLNSVTHDILQTLIKTICYTSFSAVPLTIFVMDKRFSLYIKSCFRGNRVSVEQVQPTPKQLGH